MNNLMNEMMKNFGRFASLDFSKNIEMMKEFDASKFGSQMLDFQQKAFDDTFDIMVRIQEQGEKMAANFMIENRFFPEEGRKMLDEWRQTFKKNQVDFKKTIDDNFSQFKSYFAPEAAPPEAAASEAATAESKAAKPKPK